MMHDQRLFIAVEPPDSVRDSLFREMESLRSMWRFVKWEATHKLHITMKFLGDVPVMNVEAIQTTLDEIAAKADPFPVHLGGLGVFPNTRRPRVLWIGVRSGSEELNELHAYIEEALATIGFSREKRRFSAHITVGRIKHPRFLNLPVTPAYEHGFHARHLSLIRSRLTPRGSEYTTVAEYPFHLHRGRSSE